MNQQQTWTVVVGKPTKKNKYPNMMNVGLRVAAWIGDDADNEGKIVLHTRREAREQAKQRSKDNFYWHFHPVKLTIK